ncbi:hypothetical protein [Coraliomargarita akajimensis]|uniref:Uncharacterized protein n=1 Tax=Coraliomargarita akajimensis (strain DSM 45221 / IAM 15411 / JCM 23193 / KCTC 12865 / 04OKA010-24) TaxID=583355 RepID=D5ELZ7_CORAD|nr:hypothetical protein [Coraliomargarita akajimensis]ADE55157.1 hypothetical protein Caka_2139 [Coraliomargarita akajimensis DSM 45221]
MENSNRYALVDQATGQVRFHEFDGAGALSEVGPRETYLTDITGLSSGFMDNGQEHIIVSSIVSNRIAFFTEKGSFPSYTFSDIPGPENAFPLNVAGDPDNPILITSLYGNGGQGLELVNDPLAAAQQLHLIDPVIPIYNTLPLRDPISGDQRGIATIDFISPNSIIELFRDGNSISGDDKGLSFTVGSHMTTEVVGVDGRICTIAFIPGQDTTEIFTHSFGGFTENLAPSLPLGFPIGSIAPIPYGGIPNAPDGVLITADDGSIAVFARLVPDAAIPTEYKFDVVIDFEPDPGASFTGLLPVPNLGLVGLQGLGDRVSTSWRFFANDGGGWAEVSAGKLTPWITSPSTEFATLFWYDSTPLVNPNAELLQLDIVPDWTLGGGELPTSVERETFQGSTAGLDDPTAYLGSGPAGASYVMTSQIQSDVSVSSLGTIFTMTVPSLIASPDSGTFNTAVVLNLLFDERRAEAFYRRSTDMTWTPYTGPLTIGYPTDILFYARDLTTGNMGPIMSRSYDFSVDLATIDSDKDSVPDFVEEYVGLDPFAGADTDLDFQPDLEEILGYEIAPDDYVATDANDAEDNIDPEHRSPPFLGEGFFLYAQAFDTSTGFAAPYDDGGTPTTPIVNNPPLDSEITQQALDRADDTEGTNLFAFDMRSTLLTRNEVDEIPSGSLAGNFAARLDVTSNLPDREWLVLSTPTYFDLGTSQPAPRDGRESFRVIQNPAIEPPAVVIVTTGTDLSTDAEAWIDAARAAYENFEPITEITRIDPIDTVIAALAEQALFDALSDLTDPLPADLGLPDEVEDWTLFAARDGEAAKVNASQAMLDALLVNGCDFTAMLQVIDSQVRASADLTPLANAIYDRHVTVSDTNPLMALPLDAWRSILRDGNITDPGPGDPARANPYQTILPQDLLDAQSELLAILILALDTKRPTEQWTLFIESPTTPGHSYDYRRLLNNNLAWLTDASGERFILEQGLGLNIGTSYTVTGYTDASPVAGFDTMEIISIDSIITPIATDNDTNANLLDDGWEKFFFGAIGAVDPYDAHPDTGHSYLQYQIAGEDPRSGQLEEPIYVLVPTDITIAWNPNPINAYDIEFTFPDAYIDAFNLGLESTTNLIDAPFSGPAEDLGPISIGTDRYQLRAKTSESNLDLNFFRITIGLATSE